MINFFKDCPHVANIESEPKFRVEVIKNPDELAKLEAERVQWYLSNYATYERQGYAAILRFPKSIRPGQNYGLDQIQTAIQQEMEEDMKSYLGFADEFERKFDILTRSALPVAQQLYGYTMEGHYFVAPTAYGTIAGQQTSDGPIFFRFPEYHPQTLGSVFSTGSYRTDLELLTHEVLAHGVTAHLRDGTAIDESNPRCTHQQHKEYLMDLLGRTVLTESGLMHVDNVAMQKMAMQTAQEVIDPLYFGPNGNLSWAGNLQGLVQRIDATLKEGE